MSASSPKASARGVFLADEPLNGEEPGNVANVPNLYLRTDLRTPGAGHTGC